MYKYVPFTPAGSQLAHLERDTEEAAWAALLADTQRFGMPYKSKADLVRRGYEVERYQTNPQVELWAES